MHCRELVELAALVATHAGLIVESRQEISPAVSEQYWTAAKCRLDRWLRLLKQLSVAAEQPPRPATLSWPRVRPVLEEILAGELLTRIWTATAVAYDEARSDQTIEPVARNILNGHLEARRRLLSLLADGRAIDLPQAVEINKFRRRVERWGDMLLAHLADFVDVEEFAFEAGRARDFAEDLDREAARDQRRLTCELVLASIRASFANGLAERSPNVDLNRRIGSAILSAFHDDLFDTMGPGRSLWLERITRTANDTEGMIEELMRMDAGHSDCSPFV